MAAEDRPLSNTEQSNAEELFVQLLTDAQMSLLHYVTTLLGDPHAARNVLQETNLVLWRKSSEFEMGTNFFAWARRIAYWQVQAYVRDCARDRHVFDERLIEQLAETDPTETINTEAQVALRHCLSGMSPTNRELLRMRYDGGCTIIKLAEQVGKSPTAVKVGLLRIRKALLKCIKRKMAAE